MIISFKNKMAEEIFRRERVKELDTDVQRSALKKLLILDAAVRVNELRVPPGNRLERLSGQRTGQYSIRVNDQWRICFYWREGNAAEVEIVDYH